MPRLLSDAVAKLNAFWQKNEQQVAAYKAFELNRAQVDHLIIQSLEFGVINTHHILPIIKEWRQPRHPEFADPTAYRFFNGVTEILKEISPFALPTRTVRLHHILDTFVKFGNN